MLKKIIARFRQILPFRLTARMATTYLNAWENVDYDPTTNGEEAIFRKLSAQNLGCIFDVGANLGNWTLMAKKYFPHAHVHCFEVIDTIFENLQTSLEKVPNVTINNFGLLNEATEHDLNFCPQETGKGSIFNFENEGVNKVKYAKFVTGDSYMQQNKIAHIGFLKLDIEGSEHFVLKGFNSALKEKKIDIVQFEYGRMNIVTGFLLRDFYEFFNSKSYEVGKIYSNYVDFRQYDFSHEDFRGPNFLAVLKEKTNIIEVLKS